MNFFIKMIRKIFGKNKIKYISAPKENTTSTSINIKENMFKINLMYQTDPEICDGNGYKIKKIDIKDMV